ncbi:unnamed protein product [Closterium sp. Naga37s-1]|nr:unnamed protein product [Closterium sp. Naga37s-1]
MRSSPPSPCILLPSQLLFRATLGFSTLLPSYLPLKLVCITVGFPARGAAAVLSSAISCPSPIPYSVLPLARSLACACPASTTAASEMACLHPLAYSPPPPSQYEARGRVVPACQACFLFHSLPSPTRLGGALECNARPFRASFQPVSFAVAALPAPQQFKIREAVEYQTTHFSFVSIPARFHRFYSSASFAISRLPPSPYGALGTNAFPFCASFYPVCLLRSLFPACLHLPGREAMSFSL